jgi:hypothetical protein
MKVVTHMRAIVAAVLIVMFICPSAWAGRGHHHHVGKGVAIGVGAAILGAALLAPHVYAYAPPTVVVQAPPPPPSGHWETRDVWVPGSSERVWNPAHYTRRGEWVPGRWIEIERSPGYYRQERVWVEQGW